MQMTGSWPKPESNLHAAMQQGRWQKSTAPWGHLRKCDEPSLVLTIAGVLSFCITSELRRITSPHGAQVSGASTEPLPDVTYAHRRKTSKLLEGLLRSQTHSLR